MGKRRRAVRAAIVDECRENQSGEEAETRAPDCAEGVPLHAAQTVQVRFAGEKKPENFRIDDMVDATTATLSGQTRYGFQYRLISNDKTEPDGSDRCPLVLDPKPVGAADAIDPSLWRRVAEQPLDSHEVVPECSGAFSTRSVTSYDGSGARHVVKLDGKPAYRMRLDLNGTRVFCESLPVTIGKGDVLIVGRRFIGELGLSCGPGNRLVCQ